MAFLNKTGVERLWLHIVSQLGKKVDKVDGKDLSTNDYTTEEKEQLATLGTLVGDTTVSAQINNAVSAITPDSIGAVGTNDYYGLVEKEGVIVTANSLDGAGIKSTSYITATQEGSGDPSPDNIRAISGWDTANITRTGKNLFNVNDYVVSPVYVSSTKFVSTGDRGIILEIKPNTTYTVSKATATIMRLGTSSEYPADGVAVSAFAEHSSASDLPLTVTSGANDKYMVVQLFANADTSGSYGSIAANIGSLQVEIGEAATEYETYNGQTLTAELPETVYGGTLDWNTGALTITHEVVTLDGNTKGYVQSVNASGLVNSLIYKSANSSAWNTASDIITSHTVKDTATAANAVIEGHFYTNNTLYLRLSSERIGGSAWDEVAAYLQAQHDAGTPVQVHTALSEAYTIQLTPQQLEALQGANTVWSNCGDTRALFNYSLCGNPGGEVTDPVAARENLLMVVSATEPTSPATGMLWFDIS